MELDDGGDREVASGPKDGMFVPLLMLGFGWANGPEGGAGRDA